MVLKVLVDAFNQLQGTKTTYSRAGGGVGSILLIKFSNRTSIMIWRYWEIFQNGKLLALEADDTTPITGKVAVAARKLEGKKVITAELFEEYNFMLTFEDNLVLKMFTEIDNVDDFPNWDYADEDSDLDFEITNLCEVKIEKYSGGDIEV